LYRGLPVAAGDLIISYTLNGDGNLDRTVNVSDFAQLSANFNIANTNWLQGNHNYDAISNIGDFALLSSNFNQSVPTELPRSASASSPLSPFSTRQISEIDRILESQGVLF
jgi:hypothetical protein